jgi:hypothetical protein
MERDLSSMTATRDSLLIASGAYVETELLSEFGKVPPSFLPVGNKRLLEYQVERFRKFYSRVDLTVPDDFELDEVDEQYLQSAGIRICRTSAGLALGEAILAYLDNWRPQGPIDILYGDTLVANDQLDGTDWVAVGSSDEYYHWHHEAWVDGHEGGTWTGMFSFSDSVLLRERLVNHGDFIAAVTAYGESIGKMERRQVAGWLDFGHVHTYFNSKRAITTQRHFNNLVITDGVVTKSSDDMKKMKAEASWFEHAPAPVRAFLPVLISKNETGQAGYSLEYLALATLNELFVFGRLPQRVWKKIFSACEAYFKAAASIEACEPLPRNFCEYTYHGKTIERLQTFSMQAGISLHATWNFNGTELPCLLAIAEEAAAAVIRSEPRASFIHGDLCFSNILFDFRSGRLKVIDPRGTDAKGRITAFGDFRYEIGKLAHSVIGLYDFIVARRYFLTIEGRTVRFRIPSERTVPLQKMFSETRFRGRTPEEWDCYPVMLLLFLSMLPLHADDAVRQRAMLANALRLYLDWKRKEESLAGKERPVLDPLLQGVSV